MTTSTQFDIIAGVGIGVGVPLLVAVIMIILYATDTESVKKPIDQLLRRVQ